MSSSGPDHGVDLEAAAALSQVAGETARSQEVPRPFLWLSKNGTDAQGANAGGTPPAVPDAAIGSICPAISELSRRAGVSFKDALPHAGDRFRLSRYRGVGTGLHCPTATASIAAMRCNTWPGRVF